MSIDTLKLLNFVKKIPEHRYDIRISESCVDPNPLMVKRQDPDNYTRFQTRERCALEIAAYVLKEIVDRHRTDRLHPITIAHLEPMAQVS